MNSPVDQAMVFAVLTMAGWLLLQMRVVRSTFRQFLATCAQYRWLGIGIVCLCALTLCTSLAAIQGLPEPKIHDEFSYLLGGDTLAQGRMANPPHPQWLHFETMHVLQQPSYASKYPLGQGAALAVGMQLGHPIVGVWLSLVAACGAIGWMLRAWLQPSWAWLASILATTRLCTSDYPDVGLLQTAYWSQSYWGGAVAALGGGLLLGGLKRLHRDRDWRSALAMSVGIAILAHSRPLEGMVITIPCLLMIALQFRAGFGSPAMRSARVATAVATLVLLLNVVLVAAHARAVTGAYWKLPYSLYEETYSLTRPTLLLPLKRAGAEDAPKFRNVEMEQFHVGWEGAEFAKQQTEQGYWREKSKRALGIWEFFVGPTLSLPLLAFLISRKSTWMRFSLGLALLLVLLQALTPWLHPHYWAPLAGVVYLWIGSGFAKIAHWLNRHSRVKGCGTDVAYSLAFAAMLSMLASTLVSVRASDARSGQSWHLRRAAIERELERVASKSGQRQLVIVRYASGHSVHQEWVYNQADIQRAVVVWARDRGAGNRELIEHFRSRRVWFLDVRGNTAELDDGNQSSQ